MYTCVLFVSFNCMGIDAYITFNGLYNVPQVRVTDIVSFCMYRIHKMIKSKNICITLMQYACITYRPGEVVIIFRTLSKKAFRLYICLKVTGIGHILCM